ncbi:hypothetical protein SMD22_01780 (plasmid) [Brevibacillus halotolerans]|nr:hypothetical protein SMD22_01780 [Brevibacillus halotolerans]
MMMTSVLSIIGLYFVLKIGFIVWNNTGSTIQVSRSIQRLSFCAGTAIVQILTF